ncbi:MAG: type II toxin-antitoxin system VapC family toxin [Bifidobacteriaceae bacterium]|jgi:predicted nucleic acid-binding protein|nr:type II toxin-antitoxin system VapC family toxin [Bifidobacteriaceae bacterium]
MGLVLDASALVEVLLGTPRGLAGRRLVADNQDDLNAPALVVAEVMSALGRAERLGAVAPARAAAAADLLLAYPLRCWEPFATASRAWALRRSFSPYDATYVALAEATGLALLTADQRLARNVAAQSTATALTV